MYVSKVNLFQWYILCVSLNAILEHMNSSFKLILQDGFDEMLHYSQWGSLYKHESAYY